MELLQTGSSELIDGDAPPVLGSAGGGESELVRHISTASSLHGAYNNVAVVVTT
ncbi:Hypothetical predicted protein [Lynx pardinus]|uniref:Uncharacterized protein n=1 Tax=Lynx pardinus TaxID=191816 RepID=A0A485N7N9_LYNPA|nr:Hypothetical predicted protein [Lynx pardinus]